MKAIRQTVDLSAYPDLVVIYLGMTIGAYVVLRSMAKRWRTGETDLPSPYGPPKEETVS